MARFTVDGDLVGQRRIIAATIIEPGDEVLREEPALAAPSRIDTAALVCPHCLRLRPITTGIWSHADGVQCTICGDAEVAFCSEECASRHQQMHHAECSIINPLLKLLFDLPLPLPKALLLLRCLLAAHCCAGGYIGSSSLHFLQWLEHHVMPMDAPAAAIDLGDGMDAPAATPMPVAPDVAELLALFFNEHVPVMTHGQRNAGITALEVQQWLSRIDTYAFACACGDITDGTHVAGGALFRFASFFNHSCAPNAVTRWDAKTGELVVTAITPMRTGDEITISYIPHSCDAWCCQGRGSDDDDKRTSVIKGGLKHYPRMELQDRRDLLLASRCFLCRCHRCIEEEGRRIGKPPSFEEHLKVMSWQFEEQKPKPEGLM